MDIFFFHSVPILPIIVLMNVVIKIVSFLYKGEGIKETFSMQEIKKDDRT